MIVLTPAAAPKKANRTRSTRSSSRSSLEGYIVQNGTGEGTHYCSGNEKSMYADADVDSTAALLLQVVSLKVVGVGAEGLLACLVS